MSWLLNFSSPFYGADLADEFEWGDWETDDLTGDLLKGVYVYRILGVGHNIDIDISDSNWTESLVADTDRDEIVERDRGTSWPNVGSVTAADVPGFDTSEPTTSPFDAPLNGETHEVSWRARVALTVANAKADPEDYTRAYTELRAGTELTYG